MLLFLWLKEEEGKCSPRADRALAEPDTCSFAMLMWQLISGVTMKAGRAESPSEYLWSLPSLLDGPGGGRGGS